MSIYDDIEARRKAAYGKSYTPLSSSSPSSNVNPNNINDIIAARRQAAYAPTPSQVASQQQKSKVTSTPTATPTSNPTPPASNNNWFQSAIDAIKKTADTAIGALTNQNKPVTSPIPQDQVIKPDQQSLSAQFIQNNDPKKFEGGIFNPFALVNMIDATYKNINIGISATQNAIYKSALKDQQKSGNTTDKVILSIAKPLAQVQKNIIEPVVNTPGIAGLDKGFVQTYLGGSQKVMDTLNTQVQSNNPTVRGLNTVGEIIGSTIGFLAGGEILKGAQLGKAALPVLFGTIGQTSAAPNTTVIQRLEKLPVDVVAGWLFSKVPAAKKLVSLESLKQAGLGSAIFSGNSLVDSLVQGLPPKEAAKTALQMAVIAGLFHIGGTATGLIVNKSLTSKYSGGTLELTPEQARTQANATDLAKPEAVKARDVLLKAADQAEQEGKNLQINLGVTEKSRVAKLFNAKTPQGARFTIDLVEPTKVKLLSEQGGSNTPVQPTSVTPGDNQLTTKNQDTTITSKANITQLTASDTVPVKREVIQLPNAESYTGVKAAYATILPNGNGSVHVELDPQAQKQGQGTAIVKALEQELINKGAKKSEIKSFTEAQGFWEKQGYTVVPNAKTLSKGLIIMEKTLPQTAKVTTIPIDQIDSGLSPLMKDKKLNVDPMIQTLKDGGTLPPIPVYKQGDKYILNSDGNRRYQAYKQASVKDVLVKIEGKTTLTPLAKNNAERKTVDATPLPSPTTGTTSPQAQNTTPPPEKGVKTYVFDKQGRDITNKQKRPAFNSLEARSSQAEFTSKLDVLLGTATSQEDLIAKTKAVVDPEIQKYKKDHKALAGIRTALNKEMFLRVGKQGSFKADYAMLQTLIKEDPNMGNYLSYLENKVFEIDSQLSSESFFLKREPSTANVVDRLQPAKTPEELIKKIDQLNKFAQANAILRRTGGVTRKEAVGQFVSPGKFKKSINVAKEGEARFKGKYIANNSDYVGVLAHELAHGIEFHVVGSLGKDTLKVFGDNLNEATTKTLTNELKAITEELVGKDTIAKNPVYYNKPSELLAHYFEKMIVSPGNLSEIAPTAMDLIEKQAINNPMIQEFMEAAQNNIDKGTLKFAFLRDLRQTYQKHLGKRVGNIAYDEEITHRAMQERGKFVLTKFVKGKFKGVNDDPALLFRTAESIIITRGGKPEFGTRDFVLAKTKEEAKDLQESGWEEVDTQIEDGKAYPLYARQRYTKEEGQRLFNQLSPEGKKLIVDFTAERNEATDYFNREIIKDVNKITGNIEGWVHHYFDEKPKSTTGKGLRFREKRAGTRQKRAGIEGYVEDFQKSMTKVLVDLEGEKVYNDFITRQFARVTKPIPEGKQAESGWVEVVGNVKKGVGTPQEKKILAIKDRKQFVAKQVRYQMPKEIYERYKLWKGLVDEASTAVRIVNDINRYWRINILAHIGTAGTNLISGGIQYSSKVLTDFYTETLTGNIGYKQTRNNVAALLQVLLPKGWNNAPDWVYGGDLSNWYGQFTKQEGILSKSIDTYGDKALKLFGIYERYWKKVVLLSENASNLKGLNEMGSLGLRLPTAEERALIAEINQQVDLYAYDYENVPAWLEAHQRSPVGHAIKPFAKYPYKYAKHVLNLATSVFDRSIPWQERVAKLLALTTIMALYAWQSNERKKKQQTPEGTENTPARLQTRGRLFSGLSDDKGNELFTRVGKYPFLNLSEAGIQLVNKQWESGISIFSDMFGSLSPIASMGLLAIGYRNKYQQYEPAPVILGDNLVTFMPGYRMLNDISRMFDPYQRKQTSFLQTFTQIIPTTDSDLQTKLHGSIRTVKIPIEGDISKKEGEGVKRTTTDAVLKNYWQDILLSMLTGIYISRIDPKEAEAFIIRGEKSAKKKANPQPKGRSIFRTKF